MTAVAKGIGEGDGANGGDMRPRVSIAVAGDVDVEIRGAAVTVRAPSRDELLRRLMVASPAS